MELLLAVVLAAVVPAGLTVVGMRARGHGLVAAVLAGAAFPATWVAWYVMDEHPYARRRPLSRPG